MKLTIPTVRVAWVVGELLRDLPEEVYGLRICERSGMPSGTVYPILRRMEDEGLVEAELKGVYHPECGRRVQHHYTFTDAGHLFLARAETRLRQLHLL